jgi:hypothetical protein
MAYGKKELIEDISDIRRLAGLAEAPKKAAPSAKTAANPDPNNYGSFSTNNNSPYGFAQGGSSDDTSANFFASDKRMRDAQQAAPTTAPPTRSAAPKPAAPAPKPNAYKGTIADFKRDHPGANDGQALNAIQGKTAIRGGNNDPSVIATGQVQPVYNPQSGTTMRKGEVPGQVPNRNTEPGYSGATGAELLKPGVKNAPPTGALPSAPTTRGLGAAPKSLPPRPGAAEVNVPIIRPDSPRDTSTTGGYDLDDRSDPAPNSMTNQPAPGSGPIKWDGQTGSNWKTDKAPPRPAPFVEPKTFTPPDKKPAAPAPIDPKILSPDYVEPGFGPNDAEQFKTVPTTPRSPKIEPFTSDMGDSFTGSAGSVPKAAAPGPQSYFKPTGGSSSNWAPGSGVQLASKNNSIFPHEVIKELRDLAGLGEEEEDNSPIPFKYTPSPGLPKTAMTGEKDTNPFSKPGAQSGQNSNPFNKPGAGSRMEKESVEDNMDNQGLPNKDEWEYDREGDMAKDQLHSIVRHAEELEHSLGNTENLPEWVQEKMAQIKGMMTGVTDYMMTQHERGEEQRTGEEGIHGDDMEEGNEFSGALAQAKATHQDKFEVGGKTYNVKEAHERTMSRAAKGYEKYGKEGMQALAKAGKEGKDLDKVRDKYNKYDDSVEEGIEVNPINDSLALMKRLAGLK